MWREWIEMSFSDYIKSIDYRSPSVWREWIEIVQSIISPPHPLVSLRVEGVD